MTHLIKLLGFADGDAARVKIKRLIKQYGIDTTHFVSRKTTPDHIKLLRRQKISKKRHNKEQQWRRNLERQEYFIYQDTRKWDRKHGLENDLTYGLITSHIKDGCNYCGNNSCKMGLDRIDNSLGHSQNNVVGSCTRCNLIRGNMPYKAWLFIVPKIRECYENGLFGDWVPGNVSKPQS